MWIVQEIGLGRNIKIYCGLQRVDWRGLNYLHRHLDSFAEWGLTFSQALQLRMSLALRIDRHKMDREKNGTKLHQLLETCQDCQCSNPRDKIYALLGFADDCNADNIVVDYSKSVFGVFKGVVKLLLSPRDQHLDSRDTITFIQNLQRIFGARTEMDRSIEEAEKEVQLSPKSFINTAGTCEGSIRRTSRRFDRPDVLIALFKAGITADLDQIATVEDSRMVNHSSFAIKVFRNIESEFRSRYSKGLFEDEDSYTWHFSDQFTFNPFLILTAGIGRTILL